MFSGGIQEVSTSFRPASTAVKIEGIALKLSHRKAIWAAIYVPDFLVMGNSQLTSMCSIFSLEDITNSLNR